MKSTAPDIRIFPPFTKLPASSRRSLQKRLRKFHFSEEQLIIERNQRGQFFAIVGEGVLELQADDGTEYIRMPGDWFGEEMLMSDAPSKYRAVARTDLTLWVLTRREWLNAGLQSPVPHKTKAKSGRHAIRTILFGLIILVLAWIILSNDVYHYSNQKLTGILLRADRPDLAESYLQFAVRIKPDSSLEHDLLGYTQYIQGENEAALASFEKAVQLDPDLASARNNLGVLWLEQGNADLSLDQFLKAIELDPGNSGIYFNLGNARLGAGDYLSAAYAYQRAYQLDPELIEAGENWAACLMQLGELDQARLAWNTILEEFPNNAQALQGLGVLDFERGDVASALVNLEAAQRADPQVAATYLYLGLALESLNQPDRAEVEFEHALKLSRDPALVELATTHLESLRQETRQ